MIETPIASIFMPVRVLIEMHPEEDACDVIVEMEDGTMFTALFATVQYVQRQMALQYALTKDLPETPCVRYCAIDTPHILIENLDRDTIEDTIDNLIALDVFEGLFTRVTETEEETTQRTITDGKLATQEVAAVVVQDVLVCNEV
ncbi:MAG: hypothetical protein D6712_19115 [Chloroflexi bacterium]|nr:MAG: hypothetical protein D6712_19115 [Chloroflexota bacterium]